MNKKSQKISQGLIIYRSTRYCRTSQNNIKYGFASPRFNFSVANLKKSLEKRLLTLPTKRCIQSLFAHFTLKESENNLTLKFLKRIPNFKRLSIYFAPLNLVNRRGWDAQSKAKMALKKAFIISSKATKMMFFFISCGLDDQFVLPFKDLSYMNSLNEINFNALSNRHKQFQGLTDFLIKNNRRKQRHIKLTLDSSPGFQVDGPFDFFFFAKIFEKLNLTQQSSRLNLDLLESRPPTTLQDILTFSQSFKKFPNLEKLHANSPFHGHLSDFLEALKENKRLKCFSLDLGSPQSSTSLSALYQFILLTPSLIKLELKFREPSNHQPLQEFFNGLPTNTFISTLVIHFTKYENMDDSVLIAFAKSLQRFTALKRLNIWAENKSPEITQAGIKTFFSEIGKLKDLQELELSFRGQQKVSDDIFAILCKSLEDMKELQILKLYFSESNITDGGIGRLSKVIPNLGRLDTIWLDFEKTRNESITGKSLNQLFNSFVGLPALSSINLTFKCLEIDDFCSKMLVSSLNNMRALNYLMFYLRSSTMDMSVIEYLQKAFGQFGKKFEAAFNLVSA